MFLLRPIFMLLGAFALILFPAGNPGVMAQGNWATGELDKGPAPPPGTRSEEDDPAGLNQLPKEAQGIGVDSKTGTVLDTQVTFHDSEDHEITLSDLFDGRRPVMLSFNYSNCPKLCSVQLENMTRTLREMALKVGKDFQVVSISIDPREQSSRLREMHDKYTQMYDRPESDSGWHFLSGTEKDIRFVTDQCGFRYKYIPEQKLYSHPPVFILISPEKKIVRYIHGLTYDPVTMKRALIESAKGKIGSPINILSYGLGCFRFDETKGKYTFQAMAAMRVAAGVTILGLLVGLGPYWFFRGRRSAKRGGRSERPDTDAGAAGE